MSDKSNLKSLDERVSHLEETVERIRLSGKYSNLQKNWENSRIRVITVAVSMYVLTLTFMLILQVQNPIVSALLPTVGYMLSTNSIPLVRRIWVRNYLRTGKHHLQPLAESSTELVESIHNVEKKMNENTQSKD